MIAQVTVEHLIEGGEEVPLIGDPGPLAELIGAEQVLLLVHLLRHGRWGEYVEFHIVHHIRWIARIPFVRFVLGLRALRASCVLETVCLLNDIVQQSIAWT